VIKDTLAFRLEALLNSRLLLLKVQFQLPLKLTQMSSNPMLVVSSTAKHVVLALITVLSLLVMVQTTSSLETHGVPAGERTDISELLPLTVQVSAVSKWSQLLQSSEQ